jgi:APA family basic amino acid/polyamine antiporter
MTASTTTSKPVRPSTRSLGKITAVLLTAAMIVGTGLFTSLGAATTEAGSGILAAMLIGGLIALLTGISAAEVGVNYPEEGGAFIWTRRFGFHTLSFIAGCSYLFDGIVGLGVLALGFATYSAQVLPGLPIPLAASAALIAVAAVNFFGISPTSKILIGIFLINLCLLGLYVGFAAPSVQVRNLTPVLGPGLGGVLSGAAVFFWTWDGFQRTAIMADEIKDPQKTIPFAVIGGIAIAAIIYLIVAGTTLGVLGADAMGQTDTPIFRGAATAIAGWGGWMILASAWMTAFSEMLGDLLSTSKVGHAMGKAKELPAWLGVVQKHFHSPHHALLVLTIIGVALVSIFPLRRLMPVASAFTLVWYAATNFAALKLRQKQRFAWTVVSWLGIAACLGLFLSLPRWSIACAAGVLALLAGIRWLLIRTKIRPA